MITSIQNANLDCETAEDLKAFWNKYRKASWKQAREFFEFPPNDAKPRGYLRAMWILADYAYHKAEGQIQRKAGNVSRAMEYESHADYLYSQLPEYARW